MAIVTRFDLDRTSAGFDETRSYTEGGTAIRLAPDASLSATGNFAGQSLTISGLLAEDQIGFASGVRVVGNTIRVDGRTIGTFAGGTDGADLVISFNSNATASRVQTLIRNLTFRDNSDDPTAAHALTFDLAGIVRTDLVTVTAANDRPLVDLNGSGSGTNASAAFVEQTPIAIAAAATLADPDSASFTSLTARLTSRPDGNAVESLSLDSAAQAAAAGLSVAYNQATGTLTITGSASQATYQTILQGIVYSNASEHPSTSSRTVRITVSDGEDTSATREVNIDVARANDAPVMDLDAGAPGDSAALAYNIGDPLTRIAPAGTIVDADSANFSGGSLRVALGDSGAPDDQLAIVTDTAVTLTGFAGSTVRINGTAIGTVFGGSNGTDLVVIFNSNATPARVQTLLDHIGYSNSSASPSTLPREVTFTLNDGDGTANGGQSTGSATATITFPSANDPPVAINDATTTTQAAPVQFDVIANDTDVDTANASLFISGTPVVAGGAAVGTVEVIADRDIRFTPATQFAGDAVITYVVGDGTSTDEGQLTVTVAENPQLAIDKTLLSITDAQGGDGGEAVNEVGDIIHYQIVLTNPGNVPLSGVTVSDPLVGALSGPAGDTDQDNNLDVDETWTYTANYAVTQNDVSNRFTPDTLFEARVLDPSFSAEVSLGIDAQGRLTNVPSKVFKIVALSEQAVLNLVSTQYAISGAVSTTRTTDPDDNTVLHLTDAEVQAALGGEPVDFGFIQNIATADSAKTPPISDGVSVPIFGNFALALDKSVDVASVDSAGDIITYTYTLTNTGNAAVGGITLSDDVGTPGNTTNDFAPAFVAGDTDGDNRLDVGEIWTYRATHIVSAAEVAAGVTIVNVATAGGTDAASVTDEASVAVHNALAIDKFVVSITDAQGGDGGGAVDEVGDIVSYQMVLTNSGNVALSNVTVSDPLVGALSGPSGDTDQDNKFDVDEIWTYTANYAVTQKIWTKLLATDSRRTLCSRHASSIPLFQLKSRSE
jgi:uncharacterized repeat protein (TIGR01451 family)